MAEIDNSTIVPRVNYVSTTIFWIVAAVLFLAIGIVFFIQNKNLDEARTAMNTSLKAQGDAHKKALEEQVAMLTKGMNDSVVKLEAVDKKFSEEKDALAKVQSELTATVANNDKKVLAATTKIEASVVEVTTKANRTEQGVQKVEVDVKYLKENVAEMNKKLGGLDSQISEIKTISGDLKNEQVRLQGEIKNIALRSDVTKEELASLVQRTRDFEMRVLLEHAREAQKSAGRRDYKTFLEALEFKK